MWIDGAEVRVPRSARAAVKRGILQLPEDRKHAGIVPEMSGSDNILLGQYLRYSRLGLISTRRARDRVSQLGTEYGLPPQMASRAAGRLSGGNQQKLLLARAGSQATRVLLADEPTRGVDIGAKAIILDTIRRLADAGLAVVIASSDLEEVSAVADRVYVLREGRVVAELDSTTGTEEDLILAHAFGAQEANGV
jgi:ABC-type sugar transport system ATPase subunit